MRKHFLASLIPLLLLELSDVKQLLSHLRRVLHEEAEPGAELHVARLGGMDLIVVKALDDQVLELGAGDSAPNIRIANRLIRLVVVTAQMKATLILLHLVNVVTRLNDCVQSVGLVKLRLVGVGLYTHLLKDRVLSLFVENEVVYDLFLRLELAFSTLDIASCTRFQELVLWCSHPLVHLVQQASTSNFIFFILDYLLLLGGVILLVSAQTDQ